MKGKNTMYTHIIWDFNGTIYDDVQAGIDSANRLLSSHDLPLITSKEHYRSIFGFPIVEYYKRMGFDFEKTPFADLAVEWLPYYLEESASSTLQSGVKETLEAAKMLGVRQLILSAAEINMLKGQVESLDIGDYFDDILGLGDIHARSKEDIALLWKQRTPDARPLFLGDTVHDAEVAAAIGSDCILLTCGHQSRKTLESAKCLFVADSFAEVREKFPIFFKS